VGGHDGAPPRGEARARPVPAGRGRQRQGRRGGGLNGVCVCECVKEASHERAKWGAPGPGPVAEQHGTGSPRSMPHMPLGPPPSLTSPTSLHATHLRATTPTPLPPFSTRTTLMLPTTKPGPSQRAARPPPSSLPTPLSQCSSFQAHNTPMQTPLLAPTTAATTRSPASLHATLQRATAAAPRPSASDTPGCCPMTTARPSQRAARPPPSSLPLRSHSAPNYKPITPRILQTPLLAPTTAATQSRERAGRSTPAPPSMVPHSTRRYGGPLPASLCPTRRPPNARWLTHGIVGHIIAPPPTTPHPPHTPITPPS
jgi:hypothetical protein